MNRGTLIWVCTLAAVAVGGFLLGRSQAGPYKEALKQEQAIRDSLTASHAEQMAGVRAANDSIQRLLYRARAVNLQPLRDELEAGVAVARTGGLDALDSAFAKYLDRH